MNAWRSEFVGLDLDGPLLDGPRASFGLYNTDEEIDVLVDMLNRIARGAYRGTYEPRMNGAESSAA